MPTSEARLLLAARPYTSPVLDGPLLVPPIALACVLALAGAAKVGRPTEARDAFVSLRLPSWLAGSPVPALLPWAELALAVAILVLPGPAGLVAAAAGLLLMVGYLVVVVGALGFAEPVRCSCFGRLGLGEITARTAVRNLVLVLVAALAVVAATGDRSVLARLVAAPAVTWAWLAAVLLVAALVILVRDGAGAGGAPAPFSPGSTPTPGSAVAPDGVPATGDGPEDPRAEPAGELEYVRQPIPHGILLDGDDRVHPLHSIARDQAVLLVILSAGCAPCHRAAERIGHWQARIPMVDVRPVSTSALATAGAAFPELAGQLLHDQEGRVLLAFGTHTPTAVLLGTDGLLAGGPVAGELEIDELVEDIAAALDPAS